MFQAQGCFARREKREREESGKVGVWVRYLSGHASTPVACRGYFASYFQRRIGPEKMTRTMASVSRLLFENFFFFFIYFNFIILFTHRSFLTYIEASG